MSYRQIRLMAMPIVAEYRDRAEIEVIDGSFEVALDPVSYTHLTLPTILLV